MPHYTILYAVALYRLFIPCLCQLLAQGLVADVERLPDLRSVVGLVQTIAYQGFGIGLCYCFIMLYAPAFLSLLGKLWRRPRGLLVICSGRLRRPRQALGSIKPRIN